VTDNATRRQAYLYMHISILLWGLTGVLGRGIELPEGLLVLYRLIIAVVSLLIHIKIVGYSLIVPTKDKLRMVGVGMLIMCHWLCFYGAIKYANVSITLCMLSSQGMFTALLEPVVMRSRFRWTEVLSSLLAMVGIWLVFSFERGYTVGIILGLLASFIGAFFNIFNKSLVTRYPPIVVSFYEIGSGLIGLTLLLPMYISYFHCTKLVPSTTDWALLLVLAILCTHATLALSLTALKHLRAFTLNLSINLEPIYGIALAFLFFHENQQLTIGFYLGGALILGSMLLHAFFQSGYMQRKGAVG
jgi:drug/metabolite transporter (DMT)-like permease